MKEVVSVLNMSNSDKNTIATYNNSKDLMWNAAFGVYSSANWFGNIAIVCGTGNNAGDGYALSIILKEHKINCTLLLIEERFSEDGKYYFDKAKQLGIKHYLINDNTSFKYNIIVDCLLGTGFKGIPKDNYINVINRINNSKAYVVSVDINSGLNGNNGLGDYVIKSDLTVSIGSYKYGHFLNKAMDYIKKLVNIDIGIKILQSDAKLLEIEDFKKAFKPRNHFSNKGTYGYVGIIGGSKNYIGAVKLSSLAVAALRSGCGVSRLIIPESIKQYILPNILEATIYPLEDKDGFIIFNKANIDEAIKGLKAIAIGPGLGNKEDHKKIIQYLIETCDVPLIIDADGLNSLSKIDLSILNNSKAKIVLTPHIKEFSRLINVSVNDIFLDPVKYVSSFVNQYNVTLLLKGPTTIIADKTQIYFVNSGSPGMASAGSGDVLTGIITGLLGYQQDNILFTVCLGAFINGLAGEIAAKKFGEISMLSSDTISSIPDAIMRIIN